jgi:hypothetical protein
MTDDIAQCSDDESLLASNATTMGSKASKYYLAEPAHNHMRLVACIQPVLVIQMQRFGQNGHLEDTVDMLSVSFLEAQKGHSAI